MPTPPQFLYAVLFTADTNVIDGRLHWEAHDRVTVGTDVRYYTTDGSFAVDRRDHRVSTDVGVGRGHTAGISYRSMAYEETAPDYDAHIVKFSLGYRFDTGRDRARVPSNRTAPRCRRPPKVRNLYAIRRLTWTAPRTIVKGVHPAGRTNLCGFVGEMRS